MTKASGAATTGHRSRRPPLAGGTDGPAERSLAILSYSSGQFDARSMRIARSAVARGWDVTIYCRLEPGLPAVETHAGYRIVRVPAAWRLPLPWRKGPGRLTGRDLAAGADDGSGGPPSSGPLQHAGGAVATLRRWRRQVRGFPLRPRGWAAALDAVVAPTSLWHGMWAGSLPALDRQRRRLGGMTLYDSRDVFMQSREWVKLPWPLRAILGAIERRLARRVDAVLTVNDAFADRLVRQLGVPRPRVILNVREAWTPPEPPPDLIRAALGLPRETAVVLYQGQLVSERGIEETMTAILDVPDAVLVLLGFGGWRDHYEWLSKQQPYAGKVHVLPAVAPDDLLAWTASADVTVIAIQPTTPNHRFSTPQKLFESLAAGVPVVASDLPGMRSVVEQTGSGVLCDPTSPSSIAAAIRQLVSLDASDRAALRARILDAAHREYSWEAQAERLFSLYDEVLAGRPGGG